MRYLINLCYNGSKFYGYQVQKDKLTVEGEIEKCLSTIFNTNINTIASSRTDRYVHANNQYCYFDIDIKVDVNSLKRSINSMINDYIYIKDISESNIDTRRDVINKEYIYKINMGEYNPIEVEYVNQYNKIISEEVLKEFISRISGEHNFRSFTSDKDNNNYVRNIMISYYKDGDILYLVFNSKGFLRYMIRNIVGLLLDINDGKKNISDIDLIFESENRCSLLRCASGCGLYLNKIEFKK